MKAALPLLVPGFNDSHVHVIGAGLQFDNVDLRNAPSPQDVERFAGPGVMAAVQPPTTSSASSRPGSGTSRSR
jgi:predicted amidohydrolase YtcJ